MMRSDDPDCAYLGVRAISYSPTATEVLRMTRQWLTCEIVDSSLKLCNVHPVDGTLRPVPAGQIQVSVGDTFGPLRSRVVRLEPSNRYLLHFLFQVDDLIRLREQSADTNDIDQSKAKLFWQLGYRNVVSDHALKETKNPTPHGLPVVQFTDTRGRKVSAFLPPSADAPGEPSNADRARRSAALAAMRYLRQGDIRGANAACGNLDPQSVVPLPDDPLVAMTQGYLALRQGQITHMQDWLMSAPEMWPWLPDSYVIAAECFARAGCHLTALSNLRQLRSVGLPLFTEGYTIVVNRLSSYTTPSAKTGTDTLSKESGDVSAEESTAESLVFEMAQKLASWDVAEAASMHRELAPWARYINLQRITLTLVGADLNLRIDAPRQRQLPKWLTTPAVKAVRLADQVGMLIGRGLASIAGLNDRPIHEAYGGTRDSRASG